MENAITVTRRCDCWCGCTSRRDLRREGPGEPYVCLDCRHDDHPERPAYAPLPPAAAYRDTLADLPLADGEWPEDEDIGDLPF